MALHPALPRSPYAPLDPAHRWFPADEALRASSYEHTCLGKLREPTLDDDLRDYFLRPFGPQPTGKTTDSKTDLGELIREIDELAVFTQGNALSGTYSRRPPARPRPDARRSE